MSYISKDELRDEINAILKTADLSVVSAKKVREEVERKFNCSLLSRKKEFDSIVMDFITQQQEEADEDDEEEDNENGGGGGDGDGSDSGEDAPSSDDAAKKAKKRPAQATVKKSAPKKKKRKSLNASDSGTESDGGSDSDYKVPKKTAAKKKAGSGGAAGAGAGAGAAGGGGAAAGAGAGAGGNTTARKKTGFTRAYTLSPELSALMGEEALPRHEVVKKVWAIIKERNLYDPKNKQFAICDDELMKVMKVKRFRTFGMLKHLKPHFLD